MPDRNVNYWTPAEIAAAVLWLLIALAVFVTGLTLAAELNDMANALIERAR